MKEFTIKIKARTEKSQITGKTFTYPAREETLRQDDEGRWTLVGEVDEPLFEKEVIAMCKKATNWPEIRAAHFSMDGFHS